MQLTKYCVLLIIISSIIIGCDSPQAEVSNTNSSIGNVNTPQKSIGEKKFVLTHLLGKKLPKEAYFFVEGSTWKLDYNNGEQNYFQVISGDQYNPLCGIRTIDSFKEACEICITKDGEEAIVQFKYATATLSFKGYYDN